MLGCNFVQPRNTHKYVAIYGSNIMFKFITEWYQAWKHKRKMKKRIEALRKRDPFIYK